MAGLLLCALEIPPVVDVGSREEISLCKWGGLQHGAERLIWELKWDALNGIKASVDHKPGGIEVAGLCGRQILQIKVAKLVEPSSALSLLWNWCGSPSRNIRKIKAVQRPSLPRALCRKKILSLVTFRTRTHGTRSLPPATSLPTAAMKRLSKQTFLRPGCFTVSEIFGIMKNRKKLKRPKREETYGERGI